MKGDIAQMCLLNAELDNKLAAEKEVNNILRKAFIKLKKDYQEDLDTYKETITDIISECDRYQKERNEAFDTIESLNDEIDDLREQVALFENNPY